MAQEAPTGGWRRVTDPPPPPAVASADRSADRAEQPPQADAFGQPLGQLPPQDRAPVPASPQAPAGPQQATSLPPELVLAPGTFITVRVNQLLHSDRNQPGDTFSGTLVQPIVIDGVVVAQRGQDVYGRVAEAEKAKSSQPSRLGLELTGLTLVDGTQVSVESELVGRQGGQMPKGAQVGTVGATTAIGVAVGAAADWGRGAAIGAGVGAAAGIVGVMLTRNQPTVVYPETALTFQIEQPLVISTVRAPLAFRYVSPNEYDRPEPRLRRSVPPPPPPYYVPAYYPPVYYGPAYYPYYPYRWGPGISLVFGGGYYRGGYWGRPYYRRWR